MPSLSRKVGFIGAAIAFGSLYLAAGAPTPLLVELQDKWAFGDDALTIAFAAYAFALVAAMLIVGSLSDYVGRRPVLIAFMALEVIAMVMFLLAGDVGWVIAARAVQGFATGAATSAFTAEIVELSPAERPALGGVIGSTAPAGGLALGALLTGAAVQFAANPRSLTFAVLTAVMAGGTALACFLPDTTPRRRGALRSLRPHLGVPRAAAAEFVAAIPVQIAAWMLAGLFLGLVPTVIRAVFHHDSGLLNGATVFVEPGTAAVAVLFLGRRTPREATRIGCWAIAAGTLIIVAGISTQLLALIWIGGVVGGVGFGGALSGGIRTLARLVNADERAGLFAAFYLVAYLAFGLPSVIAGQLAAHSVSLKAIATGYGIIVVVAALLGSIAQARRSKLPISTFANA
jgi:MFS family permease